MKRSQRGNFTAVMLTIRFLLGVVSHHWDWQTSNLPFLTWTTNSHQSSYSSWFNSNWSMAVNSRVTNYFQGHRCHRCCFPFLAISRRRVQKPFRTEWIWSASWLCSGCPRLSALCWTVRSQRRTSSWRLVIITSGIFSRTKKFQLASHLFRKTAFPLSVALSVCLHALVGYFTFCPIIPMLSENPPLHGWLGP